MIGKKNNKILINASTTVAQAVITGLIYYFLYKFLLSKVGIRELGVWSLVVSSSSIASMANFGITSGLVKFIADYLNSKSQRDLNELIFTALVSIATFFFIFIFIAYFILGVVLKNVLDISNIQIALKLLPYSLVSLFIIEVSSIFSCVLDGYQKNYTKNIIYIFSSILFFIFSKIWVPKFGIIGIVYAQVLQSAIVLICCVFFGVKLLKSFYLFKWQWNGNIFKSLISYGSKFQLISFLSLMYEPITKLLLGKFGSMQIVGYYEMASRLVNQVRGLIVNANQIIIPIVAKALQNGINEVQMIYKKNLIIIFFIALLPICAIIIFNKFISVFWIGNSQPLFIVPLSVLSVSAFINILSAPAYFSCLGQGKLNILVISHTLVALLNLCLGIIFGYFFGGIGVIVSWGLSFTIGSVFLILKFHKLHKNYPHNFFVKKDFFLLFYFILIFITFKFNEQINTNSIQIFIIYLIVFILPSIPSLYNRYFLFFPNSKQIISKQ